MAARNASCTLPLRGYDIGNHIIADESLGVVDSYGDIPAILCQREVITTKMREKWIRMIGFRNTLVHEYIEIDRQIVYQVLQDGLADIEMLKQVFVGFL